MKLRRNSAMTKMSLLLMLLCTIIGCGYTTRAIYPNDIKTIHVEVFKNNIDLTKEVSTKDKYELYRPNLEVDLRDAVVERFFLDGHLKVQTRPYADSILEGEIVQYRKDPLRYQDENVNEYRISIVSNIRLKSSTGSAIFLEEKNLIGDATYFTTGALMKTETTALTDAMQDLARRIVNRVVENW